jgi:trimeric autotransporter adhesin
MRKNRQVKQVMKQARLVPLSLLTVWLCCISSPAQQSTTSANAPVPPLIPFSSVATDDGGNSLSGVVNIAFSLYAAQQGGASLWTETQNNIPLDATGHYSVQLGVTKPNGVPATLFTSSEARWLGVRIADQAEQPRVLLLSVPYALKAGDSATIGGLPPSAFVLAAPGTGPASTTFMASAASSETQTGMPTATNVTGLGTVNFIPLWTSTSNIANSVLFQSAASPFKIGINTTTPATTLDVKGASTIRGILSLPVTGTATATAGKNSQPLSLAASAYNGATNVAANQTFRWQAEPAGNDTAAPSGTLNLLFGEGTATPAETGLHIAGNGQITFAPGQTFPGGGSGSGTVTSVATGLGLTGGPITTSGTLAIDTTVVPQLASANTFTANQTVNGTITLLSTGTSIVANTTGVSTAALEGNAKGSGTNFGVYASTASPTGYGVEGINVATSGGVGVYGIGATGVLALSTGSGPGGRFTGFSASTGSGDSGSDGIEGVGGNGDPDGGPENPRGGAGVTGLGGRGFPVDFEGGDGSGGSFTGANSSAFGDGVDAAAGSGNAGNFSGNVDISGLLNGSTPAVKIDDPLDPANKYLLHAPVQSSEIMNIYTGNVITDGQGEAAVQLPEWFQILNTDFRYQLTVIGQFAQAIIGHKIENNRFEIRTSAPNVEVSWQVAGVRQDAYAKAHPLVVEQEKDARLRGFYIHPELYGAPAEKQIEWARHPQMMKRIQELQARQLTTVRASAQPAALK